MARSSLGRKALSTLVAATMVVSLNAPISAWADNDNGSSGEATVQTGGVTQRSSNEEATSIDLDSFLKLLTVGSNGAVSFDGSTAENAVNGKLQVKWSPVSGCFQKDATHTCTANNVKATGDTPNRVNSHNAQYQVLSSASDVTIKNVEFVYEASDFTICANSGWAGSTTASDTQNAQLYLLNSGALTVENCSFDHVVLTGYQNIGATKVTNCSFSNAYNSYALKDMGGSSLEVSNCSFANCSGAVMTNSNSARNASSSVVISKNSFSNIDVADTAPSDKIGTRGVIQFASAGDYSSTKLDFDGNTASNCGPIIRQLNSTVSFDGDNAQALTDLRALAGDGSLTTSDSDSLPVAMAGDKAYSSVQSAIDAAEVGSTVTLLADATEDVTVATSREITLELNGCKLTNVSSHTITNNGTLTITDSSTGKSGVVDCVTHAKAALYNTGTLTLNGGTFERSLEAGTYEPYQDNGNSWYTAYNGGSAAQLTVNNGTTILNKGGFSSNVINDCGAQMTVNGGTINGGANAIKNGNDSQNDKKPTLVINGGEFENSSQYTIMNWSIATINGGKFHTLDEGTAVLFNSSYDGVDNSLTVTGGSFVATSLPMIVNKWDDNNTGTAAISGGTFSAEVPSDCLAEGYAATLSSDGNYAVAKKAAEEKSGDNSGSAQTSGVDVSNSTELAKDAVAAAEAVKDVDVPTIAEGEKTATATIGGSTVEVNEAQKTALESVKDEAAKDGAQVDVNLVVKADTNVAVNKDIEDKANGADVIPFTLSVDMVTTVKSGDEVKATASLPVTQTASAIKVTIAVDRDSILNKRVSVARNHNDVVDILSADVNYETGEVTFSTDKFSDYAVLAIAENQSYELSKYTEGGARVSIDPADFGYTSDYAFAGWYKDAQLTEAYSSSDTEGTAFPKFVKISDLIQFKGGSLRMDLTGVDDYSKTSLRFGYEMKVPDGATLDASKWGWNYTNPTTGTSGFASVQKYWLTGDNGAIANLVFSPIYKSGKNDEDTTTGSFETAYQVTAQIGYTTADGTSVTAKDQTQTRSVNQVATAIKANSFASDAEKTYANGILGTE